MKTRDFLLAAAIAAMAFTFSCSSDDGEEKAGLPTPTKTIFVDSRDNQPYNKVTIGKQTWMAENLNYDASGSKCYGNDPANCAKYGRLYDWSTAMNNSASSDVVPSGVRGVCPYEWHLPSRAEWDVMLVYIGGSSTDDEAAKLKATSGWNVYNGASRFSNGTDDYGFSALPGGRGNSDGNFDVVGDLGFWWSTTDYSGTSVSTLYMGNNFSGVARTSDFKSNLFSIRCVKD